MARPTAYKPEYNEQALKLCRMGATDKQIADFFGVTEKTIANWKNKKAGFLQSLKEGKLLSDAEISNSLFHRAKGYSHKDVDIRVVAGQIVETPIDKHYPPDATSCIFWLKNRQPEHWREKQEVKIEADTVKAIKIIDAC
jgi:hypothetical protein